MRVFGRGVPCGAFVLPCRPVLRLGGGVQAALLLPRAVGADEGARLEILPCRRAPQPKGVERGVFRAVQPHLQFGGQLQPVGRCSLHQRIEPPAGLPDADVGPVQRPLGSDLPQIGAQYLPAVFARVFLVEAVGVLLRRFGRKFGAGCFQIEHLHAVHAHLLHHGAGVCAAFVQCQAVAQEALVQLRGRQVVRLEAGEAAQLVQRGGVERRQRHFVAGHQGGDDEGEHGGRAKKGYCSAFLGDA